MPDASVLPGGSRAAEPSDSSAEISEAAGIAQWGALLDRFESDLANPTDVAWQPASAPLPPQLVDRARAVLAAQRTAIARIVRERDETLGQLTAVRRVPSAPPAPAAYIDLDG